MKSGGDKFFSFWEVLREVRDFITELLCIAYIQLSIIHYTKVAMHIVESPPHFQSVCVGKRGTCPGSATIGASHTQEKEKGIRKLF